MLLNNDTCKNVPRFINKDILGSIIYYDKTKRKATKIQSVGYWLKKESSHTHKIVYYATFYKNDIFFECWYAVKI